MNIRIKPFLLFIVISMILFQPCLPYLDYIDEIVTMFSILFILFTCKKYKYNGKIKSILIIIIMIFMIGLCGNLVNKIQTNKIAILLDMISIFKFIICFIAFYLLFENMSNINKKYLIKYLSSICKITVFLGFIFAIVNLFHNIGMHTDISYGIRSFHFIFRRVGNLNNFCARSLTILTLCLLENNDKKTKKFIFMNLILMISTLRIRAFIWALLYVFGYIFFIKKKKISINYRYMLTFLVIGLYIAAPKMDYYFNNTSHARSVLVIYGVETAKQYFPIGSGFATYGTSAAKDYRSKLYKKYNFDKYYGLSSDNGSFLTDDYWPAIMGQFGFVGALLMLLILINVFKMIIDNIKKDDQLKFPSLFIFSLLLLNSLVSSSFMNSTAVSGMIILSLCINYKRNNEKKGGDYEYSIGETYPQ